MSAAAARSVVRAGAVLGVGLLAGCQATYYAHLVRGQYDLWSRREPIERVLARPETDAALKQRLQRALDARRFATRVLRLPDNGSYTSYADLGRPFAVWNVFAAPALSLTPHEWCHPFAGCYAYRGYYDVDAARAEAARLREQGYDVHVAGVPAYSTLGWFEDPVLNTIVGSEEGVAGTIFHELAHQQEFVKGDTAFNESFATFVEHEGLRQYLRGAPELAAAAERRQRRYAQFVDLMLRARTRLQRLYASGAPVGEMLAGKAHELEQLRTEYAAVKAGWGGYAGYDGWFDADLNNARLLPFGLYHEWVPAFAALFRDVGGDWRAFHDAVAALADADDVARRRKLEAQRAAAG